MNSTIVSRLDVTEIFCEVDDFYQNRSKRDREFELLDTEIFDNNTYFDVFVEYAKNTPEDILIKISIANRVSETRNLYLLLTLWFRNTWA
ncbi:hypothetical protein B7486_28030 [cyanobacterium TDX16]|nr:hypothetical protein B7486_28030 [cyanobacterium TDX16]